MAEESSIPRGRFVILDWTTAHANHASFEQALGLAQREHTAHPEKRFAIVQVVALVEPVTTSRVTLHRF
jgi:hypothetical protein